MSAKPYSVLFWGSHPDDDNDDCHSGEDFATRHEAMAYFNGTAVEDACSYTAWIVVDGPDVSEERPNPDYDAAWVEAERLRDDAAWRHEIAMEAGMLGGCDAYNDAMGF
jgi:hypothetical protein